MNILDAICGIYESATTYKELNDMKNGRFFKEYKHDESAELGSRKLEHKLREINPSSVVIRQDPFHFVMVHPGGDLITTAESTDTKHMVSTHHISPFARDFGKKTEMATDKHVLYESLEDQFEHSDLYESVGVVNSDYIVHDSKGNIFFRHKNQLVLKHAISNMQKHYFHDHPAAHHVDPDNLQISPRDTYIKKFGSNKLRQQKPMNMVEDFQSTHEVHFSHIRRKDGVRVKKKFHINYAIDPEHAQRIAHRIARNKRLLGFRILMDKS